MKLCLLLYVWIVLGIIELCAQTIKPKPVTQIKVNDAYTLDNKEFTFMGVLQRGELTLGDTLEVYTQRGLMGKCKVTEFANPYTEEEYSFKRAVCSLKITVKTIQCGIDEHTFLITPGHIPFGLRLPPPPKKPSLDTTAKPLPLNHNLKDTLIKHTKDTLVKPIRDTLINEKPKTE